LDLEVSKIILGTTKCQKTKLGTGAKLSPCSDIRYSIVGDYSTIGGHSKVTHSSIRKFCSVSWDFTIHAVSHSTKCISTHSFARRPDWPFGAVQNLRRY